jgi:hypothetical protein
MNRDLLVKQLKAFEHEFLRFMDIKKFFPYELQTKEASITVADSQGFDSAASTSYYPQSGIHTLLICSNIPLEKYLIYHEFTHMLDAEMYGKGNKLRCFALSGFTEYHASQVELMQLLGANSVDEVLSFSMNTTITTIAGERSIEYYVNEKYQHAIELFSRDDFPADLDTLITALGVLFNYFGLRSLCEVYSVDYTESKTYEPFLSFISTFYFTALNGLMHGWFDESKIESCINIYINIINPLINEFQLAPTSDRL